MARTQQPALDRLATDVIACASESKEKQRLVGQELAVPSDV